ncbi:unnamed protein product [Parascedosporium putredinis]|uniref:Enhancer of mRNA-decapping protein 3 n=1 Tax=Parascedosporium putredinis TaxID=1442378 RepID=A0A9P1HBC0_9PEZI|nr:unnamed protein product [Parascedosporium putredinis]CAI8003523.1 unnamed protein product [Parascedosporium putredinis]
MANEFIGLHMLLKGTISDISIAAGDSGDRAIVLSNVFVVGAKGQWYPRLEVRSDNILDLAEPSPATFTAPTVSGVSAPVYVQPTQAVQPVFGDPAILSVGLTKPGLSQQSGSPLVAASSNTEWEPQAEAIGQPSISGLNITSTKTLDLPTGLGRLNIESPAPAEAPAIELEATAADHLNSSKKKRRERKKVQPKHLRVQDPAGQLDSSPAQAAPANRGKGWRQTPILESTASFQPFMALKRNGAKGRRGLADNGWASEDVTEEMGEFDFEGGLAKFDKRTLFDQMRKQDQVDDSERLVSYNRRPKPGTAGGKNFHYSENVLDTPSSISKALAPNDFGIARPTTAHTERIGILVQCKTRDGRTARSQSRKASAAGPGQPLSRVNSAVRQQLSAGDAPKYQILQRAHSPKQQNLQPGLYLVPSDRRVEPVSALQMLNLENIAANEVGLTEEMMTENAGRGIAEVALTALTDPAIGVRMGTSGRSTPVLNIASHATIIILAGNNKSGIRAVAAGRHLRSKGANAVICLVGIEREVDLLEDMRQQIRIYRNFGGRIFNKQEFFEHLRKLKSGNHRDQVSLIIDALLGLTISFEELRTGDQASVYELMEWANRNEAFVLSIDVPTGIDPTSGKVSIIDGSRLFVKPRYVVAMGAPKRGLLEAISPDNEDGVVTAVSGPDGIVLTDDDPWKLYIADIGLGPGVWKKAGTKMRRGIDFDAQWVLEMRYQGDVDDEEDE